MARPRSSQSVALFPFLAVLVCTMGSLIFLLLVTTRMIRDRVTTSSTAQVASPPQLPLLSVESPLEPESTEDVAPQWSPIEIPAESAEAESPADPPLDVRAVALEQRERELAALAARWQDRVASLNEAREERARLRSQRQQLEAAASKRLAAMQAELKELEVKLGNMTGEISASSMGTGTARERIELETQIKELKKRLRAAQQADANDNSKFEVVPFDVVSGTSRRPILIECTSTGIRFIPEDVTITKEDLAGFNPHVNPLLVGANALSNYWTAWNIRQPNPARQPEPYVLLLVRPSGTVAYYVAMNLLRDLKQPHGYELIAEDTELQMPEVDAGAKAACETAVKKLIGERDQMLRSAGLMPGSGGGGRGTRMVSAGGRPGSGDPFAAQGAAPAGGAKGSTANGSDTDQFELTDIMNKEDAGGRSWERVENFEGSPRRNSPGGQVKPGAVGRPAGPAGNSRTGTGVGAGNSSGRLAVAAGGTMVDDTMGSPQEGTSPQGTSKERTPSQGRPAKPGTVPGSSGSSSDSGIESLDGSEQGEDSEGDGQQQPGKNSRPDTGLGSSGKPHIPVEDQRGKKRKSTDREAPTEPEQLAHRHWGLSDPGAAIGLEREVRIDIEPKRYVIGRKHSVAIEETDGREDSFAKIVTVLDLQARDWGKPPQGFFWKPSLRFVIADGGDANYERVHSLLERAGLTSTREYAVEYSNQQSEKPKAVEHTPVKAPSPAPAPAKPQRRLFRGILK